MSANFFSPFPNTNQPITMITQKDLEQLALLKTEAEKSTHLMEEFQQEMAEAVTEIVLRRYPVLKEMDAEYIRDFGELVSRSTWELAVEMDHLASEVSR